MNKALLFIFFFLFYKVLIFSQFDLNGVVKSETNEPLAFVNILINEDYANGTITDIDGKFEIQSSTKIQTLTLSYVGFEKLTYEVRENEFGKKLQIQMRSTSFDLPEAIVFAGENPAHRIIRKVVKNRDQNNPEKMQSFQCMTYNKVVFEWIPNEPEFEKYVEEKADTSKENLTQKRSTNFKKLVESSKERHLFLMESVSERKYLFPAKNSETVLYNRVSGLKNPSFVALANDIQPFSFYETYLEILDKAYLNPISPGSANKYFFNIVDTLFQNPDTIFIISYRPWKNKNFEGLEGVLYINTDGYALQNVIARPSDKSLIDMKIEQRYARVGRGLPDSISGIAYRASGQWFPEQLNFVIEATKYPHRFIGTRVSGKSYIDQVQLNPSLDKKEFKTQGYTTAEDANTRADSVWQKYRFQDLTNEEKKTYEVMDSLGEKKNFDTWLDLAEAMASGRFSIGKIDVLIYKMLTFNDFESVRLGLGFATNDQLSRFFEVGGYGGYGFRDNQWKYGGYLLLKILPEEKLQIRFDYQQDIRESAFAQFSSETSLFSYTLYANLMDNWENRSVNILGKIGQEVYFDLSLSKNKWVTNYKYNFYDGDLAGNYFQFTEAGLKLRFAFREKIVRVFGTRVSETNFPKIFISFKKGFKNMLDGEFDYEKVLFAIVDDFRVRNVGKTRWRVETGMTWGKLPYSRLFSSSGMGRGFEWLEIENTFQTMDLYEFLSDRFVHLFFEHNFGTLLFKSKNPDHPTGGFQPEFSIVQNIGFGNLRHPEHHQLIEFKTMDKGFFESGFRIDNLLKINYFNLMYLGFGAGIYYRFGAYAFPEFEENLAYRFRLKFSF